MLHKIFFAQNRMMTPVVPTYAVTFTVKEFLIDPDNSFADTEIGVLQYMTVKIGSETKLTNASGQAVFNLEAGTHVYEIYDNDRYLTTVRGEVTVISSTESVMAKVYPCLYTPLQVWNMIEPPAWTAGIYDEGWHVNYSGTIYVALLETSEEPGVGTDWAVTDSYVPVATPDEFFAIIQSTTQTTGLGSIFQGSYATGRTKNYIIVLNIDYDSYVFPSVYYVDGFSGIYNGNNLYIINFSSTSGNNFLFWRCSGAFKNIKVALYSYNATGGSDGRSMLVSTLGSGGLIENCFVNGSLTSYISIGGVCGVNYGTIRNSDADVILNSYGSSSGGFVGVNYGTIRNSDVDVILNSYRSSSGGFVGNNSTNGLIENCSCISSITAGGGLTWIGGFVGSNPTSTSQIKKCSVETTITRTGTSTSDRAWGGFAGGNYNNGLIENCYSRGSIQGYARVGGFTGQAGAGGSRHTNCYAAVAISGTNTVGGFAGNNGGGTHVTTNSYFDSDVAGTTTTIFGLARTTLQMKEGTEDSFILPTGGTDPDSLAANAMYTSWDTDIWDFLTTADYPELK